MFDSKGLIHRGRKDLDAQKQIFSQNHTKDIKFVDAFKKADVFLGLSKGGLVDKEMIKKWQKILLFLL